jgi:25S rRNA (adenine2142-N1)-methyltransferase
VNRLLDVGSLKHDNYVASKSFIDATPIDLHSRHVQIIQQDFMQINPASDAPFHHSVPSNTNWDVISLSLVLNFVPDPQERGRMLKLTRDLLAPDGLLFVVVSTRHHG